MPSDHMPDRSGAHVTYRVSDAPPVSEGRFCVARNQQELHGKEVGIGHEHQGHRREHGAARQRPEQTLGAHRAHLRPAAAAPEGRSGSRATATPVVQGRRHRDATGADRRRSCARSAREDPSAACTAASSISSVCISGNSRRPRSGVCSPSRSGVCSGTPAPTPRGRRTPSPDRPRRRYGQKYERLRRSRLRGRRLGTDDDGRSPGSHPRWSCTRSLPESACAGSGFRSKPGRPEKPTSDLTRASRELAIALGAMAEDRRAGTRRRQAIRHARGASRQLPAG